MPEYVPGICNIGSEEIARRRRTGFLGLALALLIAVGLVAISADKIWRILLFFPLLLSASGFWQAQLKFCYGYGFAGIYNVLKPAGEIESVDSAEFRRRDRLKALQVLFYAAATAAAVTVLFYLL